MSYTKEALTLIIKEHHRQFISRRKWDSYAINKDLPSSSTFIHQFGNWKDVKELASSEENIDDVKIEQKKAELLNLAKKYSEYFNTKDEWQELAKKENLPLYETISRYLKWSEFKKASDINKKRIYTDEELIQILKDNFAYTQNKLIWREFAKKNNLPSDWIYYRRFRSWAEVKNKLYL